MRAALLFLAACGRIGFDSGAPAGDAPLDVDHDADLTAHLIGWWQLDEGTGTTAADSSGLGNTGTLSAGISWATGKHGSAADFDNNVDRAIDVGFPAAFQLTGSMTLAAWMNARTFDLGTLGDDPIIARDDNAHGESGWSLKGSEDCSSIQHALIQIAIDNSTIVQRCSVTVLQTNTWYHLAGVYDASLQELHIYVDGVLDDGETSGSGAVPAAQHQAATAIHVQIGNQNPQTVAPVGGNATFDGLIDDVRIYDAALDAQTIAQLAN